MTEKRTHFSAGSAVLREDIAKTIWLAEYRRATGKERSITWYDVAEDDRLKYLFVADAIVGVIPAPAQPTLNKRLGIGLLWTVHSALDEALGDSDVTHIEDDAELRERHPVQWAAQRLAEAISLLEDASQPSPAATVETLNGEAREHPSYDNPRDPFASPDRLPPSSSADNDAVAELKEALRLTRRALKEEMEHITETLETVSGVEPQAVSVQQVFEECAALMQRWSDDAAEFSKDNERCQIQANVCRNAAVAILNLSSRLTRPQSGGES